MNCVLHIHLLEVSSTTAFFSWQRFLLQTEAKAVRPFNEAPAPGPGEHAGALPTFQAPSASYFPLAPAGSCEFSDYRPYFLDHRSTTVSVTLQSTLDGAEVQFKFNSNAGNGPATAQSNGASTYVAQLQTVCKMRCVPDRGDELFPSPTNTFSSPASGPFAPFLMRERERILHALASQQV